MIRVELPAHLRTLARVNGEVQLEVEGPATVNSVLDELERRYPMLQGTIRDHVTGQRRAYVRFFAVGEDVSHEPMDAPLPETVAVGKEPLLVVGAIAGGSAAAG
jgi:molybdopterin converting factor small subunit